MKTRNIILIAVVATLFVVATVLVIVGVTTHREPGFTDADKRWTNLPLSVTCAGFVSADDAACSTAEDVVDTINSRLGFNMLLWTPDTEETGDIHLTMRAPVEVGTDEPGGHYDLLSTGAVYDRCDVRTMNVSGGATDLEWLTIYHELGHCLGLAHDDYDQSIMRPVQRATENRALPPWISDFDRSLLRGKYGAEE